MAEAAGNDAALNAAGAAVRDARLRQGLTQAGLASRLGISKNTVGHWERTGRPPQARLRQPLAEALGLDLDDLSREWGLPQKPSWARVIRLDHHDAPTSTRSANAPLSPPDSQVGTADPKQDQLRTRFLETVLAGLEQGHACHPEWIAAATATATTLGVDWTPNLPSGLRP